MIRQTSLSAFQEVRGGIGLRQQFVLSGIKALGFVTDKQLAKFLQWPINCVTPRRGELVKLGLVKEVGFRVEDGRQAILWRVA